MRAQAVLEIVVLRLESFLEESVRESVPEPMEVLDELSPSRLCDEAKYQVRDRLPRRMFFQRAGQRPFLVDLPDDRPKVRVRVASKPADRKSRRLHERRDE